MQGALATETWDPAAAPDAAAAASQTTSAALPATAWAEEAPAQPLPADWAAYTSPDGYTYYYSATTGVSTWEKPEPTVEHKPLGSRSAELRKGAAELSAQWFGALHLEHLSPEEMHVNAEKAVALHEVMHMTETHSSLKTSFQVIKKQNTKDFRAVSAEEGAGSNTLPPQTVQAVEDYIRQKGVCELVSVLQMLFGVEESQLARYFNVSEENGKMYAWVGSPEKTATAEVGSSEKTATAKADASAEDSGSRPSSSAIISRQHLPLFTVIQVLVCFCLWLIPNPGQPDTGLESIWPLQTDLCIMWQCADLRMEFFWRCLTYQFTHVGAAHVIANCVMTFFFGIPLEGLHGWWRMALMFNAGVFGGACCYLVFDGRNRVVGMSGGCYALLGMHVGDVVMNFTEQQRAARYFRNGGLSQQEASTAQRMWRRMIFPPWLKLGLVLVFGAMDVLITVVTPGAKTSYSAHAGGAVAGVLICIVAGHNFVWRDYERVLLAVALVTGVCLAIVSIAWGVTQQYTANFSEQNC